MESLSVEILDNIIVYLPKSSLCNSRLVNRSWHDLASRHLFAEASLFPTLQVVSYRMEAGFPWIEVVNSASLRKYIRKATVNSFPKPSSDGRLSPTWIATDLTRFYKALHMIAGLPSLQAASLRFSSNWSTTRASDFVTSREEDREQLLVQFFRSLDFRQSKAAITSGIWGSSSVHVKRVQTEITSLTSLTFDNLQPMATPTLYTLDAFKSVIAKLKDIHFHICQLDKESYSAYLPKLPDHHEFYTCLSRHYLSPPSANLRSLTIIEDEYWGALPSFSPLTDTGLTFPALRSLTLGRYAIVHSKSLNWVWSLKSLTSLRLYGCAILGYISVDRSSVDGYLDHCIDELLIVDPTEFEPPLRSVLRRDPTVVFKYDGTWAEIFERIGKELPRLLEFTMKDYNEDLLHQSRWNDDEDCTAEQENCLVEDDDLELSELSRSSGVNNGDSDAVAFPVISSNPSLATPLPVLASRHCAFNQVYSRWTKPERNGDLRMIGQFAVKYPVINPHRERKREDGLALRQLTDRINSRRLS